jgi:glycosyltransferase involved in cell wall biosynthesis
MLSPWSRGHHHWKKRLAWILYQKRDLAHANALHATSYLEAGELRELGILKPIVVIPNGVDFPEKLTQEYHSGRWPKKRGNREMLFLSRIHPKKGVEMLLKSWRNVPGLKNWTLKIVGPSEDGYREEMKKLAENLQLGKSVSFFDQVSDEEKWDLYARASVFVLPTYSENFGIVVAEALSSGTPVLTTTTTPWNELDSRKCGWCVGPSEAELTDILMKISGLDEVALSNMGINGQRWILDEFSWSQIGLKMIEFYSWLHGKAKIPDFVLTI